MTDVVDSITRSRMMSGIRGKNTKPELLIRSALHRLGFRFKLHDSSLVGKPDLVFPKYHAVIFVHGCFWHMHECKLFKWPLTRIDFWKTKLNSNRTRDCKQLEELMRDKWRVCIVWECAVKGANKNNIESMSHQLSDWLKQDSPFMEIRG